MTQTNDPAYPVNENKLNKKFSTKDVTEPKSGLVCYTESWWICLDGDPKKALFYGSSPQCNKDKRIGEHLLKGDLYKGMNVSIVFIDVAYVPQRD